MNEKNKEEKSLLSIFVQAILSKNVKAKIKMEVFFCCFEVASCSKSHRRWLLILTRYTNIVKKSVLYWEAISLSTSLTKIPSYKDNCLMGRNFLINKYIDWILLKWVFVHPGLWWGAVGEETTWLLGCKHKNGYRSHHLSWLITELWQRKYSWVSHLEDWTVYCNGGIHSQTGTMEIISWWSWCTYSI